MFRRGESPPDKVGVEKEQFAHPQFPTSRSQAGCTPLRLCWGEVAKLLCLEPYLETHGFGNPLIECSLRNR